MGITINGSSAAGTIDLGTNGTIADLAVGGIPDGTIDSDAIAANAVTGNKIAMGSDAAGDIMYYNGTDYIRLAKGTDGQVLTLASGVPSWAAAAGGGKVLQVKHVMTATTTTPTANDTAQDLTNMSLAITPAHASNKILCIASTQYEASGSANGGFRIRNTTANQNVTTESVFQFTIGSMERQTGFIQGYDHPNSTSAQTYKVQGINWSAGSNTFIFGGNGAGITLTLIEVDLS
jgi:hypothetical protein